MRTHPGLRLARALGLVALAAAPVAARMAALGVAPAAAEEMSGEDLERQIKAAYLYKFSGYVEWPHAAMATDRTPLVIGVMGDEALAEDLENLLRQRAEDARPVSVVRVKAFEPLPTLHVLFIGRSESDHLAPLIRAARERPILVVTDTEGALALGSMINFDVTGGRVRFDVGLASAQKSGLIMSSRLLAVAQMVEKRSP
ncbi:MAG TPA: YfiR family protein [Candidatus Eisenbacteria bacterium]|nr:YfiR family protein [Candidatus Eisenbacteria bacterium]